MSQYGSDSDRPRGRRHRPDSDWAGYDAPQGSREFPDLQPIRPREARARDARQPGGGFAGGAVPGSYVGGGHVPGAFGGGQQAPQGFQDQQGYQGYQDPQQGYQDAQGYQGAHGAQYGQYGQPESGFGPPQRSVGRHSAPMPVVPPETQQPMGQPSVSQPSMAQPPMTQPPASRPGAGRRGGRSGWDDEDSDDPMAAFSERWRKRGQDSPGDQRKRKRLYLITGGVAVIAIAALVYFLVGGPGTVTDTGANSLVTTLLPGELKSVPNACTSVPAGTVSQALPGQAKQVTQPMSSGGSSQCTWTLDHPPTYRVLEVSLTAESPSGLASGDGSATFNAEDTFSQDEAAKKKPAARQQPPTVTDLPNLGSSAFSAFQQFNSGGSIMDMATVEVRYHNVIIQVVLNGIDKSSPGKTPYGPVSQSTLTSQAQTVAQQVTSKVSGG